MKFIQSASALFTALFLSACGGGPLQTMTTVEGYQVPCVRGGSAIVCQRQAIVKVDDGVNFSYHATPVAPGTSGSYVGAGINSVLATRGQVLPPTAYIGPVINRGNFGGGGRSFYGNQFGRGIDNSAGYEGYYDSRPSRFYSRGVDNSAGYEGHYNSRPPNR